MAFLGKDIYLVLSSGCYWRFCCHNPFMNLLTNTTGNTQITTLPMIRLCNFLMKKAILIRQNLWKKTLLNRTKTVISTVHPRNLSMYNTLSQEARKNLPQLIQKNRLISFSHQINIHQNHRHKNHYNSKPLHYSHGFAE